MFQTIRNINNNNNNNNNKLFYIYFNFKFMRRQLFSQSHRLNDSS
jgi:hypothetical protein